MSGSKAGAAALGSALLGASGGGEAFDFEAAGADDHEAVCRERAGCGIARCHRPGWRCPDLRRSRPAIQPACAFPASPGRRHGQRGGVACRALDRVTAVDSRHPQDRRGLHAVGCDRSDRLPRLDPARLRRRPRPLRRDARTDDFSVPTISLDAAARLRRRRVRGRRWKSAAHRPTSPVSCTRRVRRAGRRAC